MKPSTGSKKKGITSGNLLSDSHQSVLKAAYPVLEELKQQDYISKIVVGKIRNVPSRVPKLLAQCTGTSVRLTVKARGEIQEFYVIGSNLSRIERKVKSMSQHWR